MRAVVLWLIGEAISTDGATPHDDHIGRYRLFSA